MKALIKLLTLSILGNMSKSWFLFEDVFTNELFGLARVPISEVPISEDLLY